MGLSNQPPSSHSPTAPVHPPKGSQDLLSYTTRRGATTFLSDIRKNPHILSRSTYKDLYKNMHSELPESYQDVQFDQLTGVGVSHVSPAVVDQEIEELKRVTQKLKKYVDKRVAHYDRKSPPLAPSYKDIDEAFEFLGGLLSRYYQFFRGASFSEGPYIQYDWKQIFRLAWIPESD